MVSKRRPIHSTNLNFRTVFNNSNNADPRGTKPTSEPTSIKEIFTLMVLYVCKKSLFFDTNLKVAIYLGCLFLISLITDFVSIPKSYLSRSDNIFNKVFVKFAWGWNLILILPFVIFTSLIYCCGNKQQILKYHVIRICVATFFWWFWTTLFNVIEASYGRCGVSSLTSKSECLQQGHVWNGLDLSGHCFILVYGSLFAIEESRCISNWDGIKEYIRLEEHSRNSNENSATSTNPLRNLSDDEFKHLKYHYEKYTPYIRVLVILIAVFQILWDVMLVCTILYYHIMIEKFLGGVVAILTWFITYRVWYSHPCLLPKLPGEGTFKYIKSPSTPVKLPVRRRKESLTDQGPLFMGRPIYAKVKPEDNIQSAR